MYEEMERKRYSKPIQTNEPANIMQQKQEKINNSRSEGMGSGNVIQRTKWRYVINDGSSEDGKWDIVDEGGTPSSEPTFEETRKLLNDKKDLYHFRKTYQDQESGERYQAFEIETSSVEYIKWVLEHFWVSRGANQSLTYHSPTTATRIDKVPPQYDTKLQAMYGEVPEHQGIRGEREYSAEEDIHRFLRWVATDISVAYGTKQEIQCYYDKTKKRILVGANSDNDIEKLVGRKQHSVSLDKRQIRHLEHLRRFQQIVLEMINNKEILENPVEECQAVTNGPDGLHAEQRILKYIESLPKDELELSEMIRRGVVKLETDKTTNKERIRLDPQFLGGLRRCCMACKNACFSEKDSSDYRPGPVWPSDNALAQMQPADRVRLLEDIRENSETYVTGKERGRVTDKVDTDSETEDTGLEEMIPKVADQKIPCKLQYYDEEQEKYDEADNAGEEFADRGLYERIIRKLLE